MPPEPIDTGTIIVHGNIPHVIATAEPTPTHHAKQTKQLNGLMLMDAPIPVKSVMVNANVDAHNGIINK
jgi:hypothetical protein